MDLRRGRTRVPSQIAFDRIAKRDGRIVRFDAERITAAIAKAGAAAGDFGAEEARRLCLRVLAIASATLDGQPTVERIQGIVEEALLTSPHRRAARAYIVYREQHRALRAVSDAANVALVDQYLDRMRDRLVQYQKETGTFFNLEATPAEGTSYRLARLDKERYPDLRCANEDTWRRGGEPYYTNSSQRPVNASNDVFAVLDHQDEFQAKYTGGTVQHIFAGEAIDDPAVVIERKRGQADFPDNTLQGRLLAVLALLYGTCRFLLDFLRASNIDYADARYFGLTPAQYFCFGLVVYAFWRFRAAGTGLSRSKYRRSVAGNRLGLCVFMADREADCAVESLLEPRSEGADRSYVQIGRPSR